MPDTRLHNDCDGGNCVACRSDEIVAKGAICETCYWWLRDSLGDGEGVCRRWRPATLHATSASHTCHEHSFDSPYWSSQKLNGA